MPPRRTHIEPSGVFFKQLCGYYKTFVLSVILNILVDKDSLLNCVVVFLLLLVIRK